MRQIAAIAVFVLGLSAPAWADGPSFDCAKAATPVEKAICASGDLSTLDRQIAEEYRIALSLGQVSPEQQRAWLAERNKACAPQNTTDCLRQVMIERHAFLTLRPEGYRPPVFQGHPSFDCSTAQSITDKAVCGNQRLSELDVALQRMYETARREHLYLAGEMQDWRNDREAACGDQADLAAVVACIEEQIKYPMDRASRHAEFDEERSAVNYYGSTNYVNAIESGEEIARITSIFSGFGGARIEKCTHVTALPVERRIGESADYGAVCAVDRRGKKRES